jgi:cyclophilin family peptidyl-prolyl cis-trans isomerase
MRNRLILAVLAAVSLAGCSKSPSAEATTQPEKVPDVYRVKFDTSKGPFVIEVHREWAPFGADRFYEVVKSGFYNNARFFRVLKGFIVQWGISGDPDLNAKWINMTIPDDPVKQPNTSGMVTFAKGGPASRTTQVFINLADNSSQLDAMGFAPFGRVVEGMNVVYQLYGGYGEGAPQGAGPDQNMIQARGNQYLEEHYPRLDFIKTATIE